MGGAAQTRRKPGPLRRALNADCSTEILRHSYGFGPILSPPQKGLVFPTAVQMRPESHMNNEHHLPPACGQSPSPKFEHFLFSCKHALIFCT